MSITASCPNLSGLSQCSLKEPCILSPEQLHYHLNQAISASSENFLSKNETVILCIGTDRIIGDSLGPLVGSILGKNPGSLPLIYGTLHQPVHALNLRIILDQIKKKHPHSPVIAVDASLGPYDRIGSAFIRTGCILPGAGVNKKLPPAGHIAITGIVNEETSHPYLALQTSRLSTVAALAEQISACLLEVLT